MKKITWTNERRKVAELLPASYNPRSLSEDEKRNLQASIVENGEVEPVVINIGTRNNTLIGGHQRCVVYAELGIQEIDVRVPSQELTLDEEKRLNLHLNHSTGHFEFEKLKEMDMDMLLDVGFGDEELQLMFDNVDVLDDEYNVGRAIKEMKEPTVAPGEVWQLGDHNKLMIGDSTQPDALLKLMGGDLADMIISDPPYNIGLDYSKGISTDGKYEGTYTGKKDSKKDTIYASFIDASIKAALAVTKPDAHIFYWCDEKYIWLLQTLFAENKIDNKRVCLWIKNNFNMTPQIAFNKVYEPCVYGIRGTPFMNKNIKNLNEILNAEIGSGNQVHEEIMDMITLWVEKRVNAQDYTHPTEKPVTLSQKPLKRCSAPGHIILDSFAGSGSSLMAAHQLNRKWRGMEQDVVFGSIIVDRFEKFTGIKAIKI
jgi:DNA modification methylase